MRLHKIPNDKTHNLGFFDNCYIRDDESDSIPFPELSNGKTGNVKQDLGGPIICMLEKLKKRVRLRTGSTSSSSKTDQAFATHR